MPIATETRPVLPRRVDVSPDGRILLEFDEPKDNSKQHIYELYARIPTTLRQQLPFDGASTSAWEIDHQAAPEVFDWLKDLVLPTRQLVRLHCLAQAEMRRRGR